MKKAFTDFAADKNKRGCGVMFARNMLIALDNRFPDIGTSIAENRMGNYLMPGLTTDSI